MHNAPTRTKAQTVAYADTQKHTHTLLQRKTPLPNTKQYTPYALAYKLPPTQKETTPPPEHRKPPPTQPKQRATGVIPINKESKIYYGTYKPRQRRDTTTTPSNTPQTRAPSLTKRQTRGSQTTTLQKWIKQKHQNRCPTTIPQKKNKEKEHHPAHGNHRTRSTALPATHPLTRRPFLPY